jgi:hypothetical protein
MEREWNAAVANNGNPRLAADLARVDEVGSMTSGCG